MGGDDNRFRPHAAQHDFEAWLLPYWSEIRKLAGSKKKTYIKPRDAGRILRNKDLTISAQACPELKTFLNTILSVCEGDTV